MKTGAGEQGNHGKIKGQAKVAGLDLMDNTESSLILKSESVKVSGTQESQSI